jgi:hypothetical protein
MEGKRREDSQPKPKLSSGVGRNEEERAILQKAEVKC